MAIKHIAKTKMLESGLFTSVSSYDQLQRAMVSYSNRSFNDDQRCDRLGEAFEVFAEYFFARCGKHLGVKNVRHTSKEKFHRGVDFYAKGLEGEKKIVQVKYRAAGSKLDAESLRTFSKRGEELGVLPKDRILFTNHTSTTALSGWYEMWGGRGDMNVVGREQQEAAIKLVRGFWPGFVKQLGGAPLTLEDTPKKAPKPFKRDIVPGAIPRAQLEGRATTKPSKLVVPDLTKSTSVFDFYSSLFKL